MPIDRITVHCLVGQWTAAEIGDYFARPATAASCNYGVGKSGDIVCCVPEGDRSWCSSSAANDNRAVTIEVASDTYEPYKVTEAAFEALLNLCEDICRRNGKNKLIWIPDKTRALAYKPAADEMLMTVHRWFAPKSCPGDYLLSRHSEIADVVTRRLRGVTPVGEKVYNTIAEMPAAFREALTWFVSNGIVQGTAAGLDLTRNMCRMLVFLYRTLKFLKLI